MRKLNYNKIFVHLFSFFIKIIRLRIRMVQN